MIQLRTFQPSGAAIEVRAGVRQEERRLVFEYQIQDPRGEAVGGLFPGTWTSGFERKNELWKATCCEAFWGQPGDASYFELNLSPHSPAWQLYKFTRYREPQPPAIAEEFEISRLENDGQRVICELKSARPLLQLEFSLTAVVMTAGGPLYFAGNHAGTKPDFHDRRSFTIKSS